MSRAYQAQRAMEREQLVLDRDYADGTLSAEDYRRACRELERELQAAYAEDQEEAQRAVRDEWGL